MYPLHMIIPLIVICCSATSIIQAVSKVQLGQNGVLSDAARPGTQQSSHTRILSQLPEVSVGSDLRRLSFESTSTVQIVVSSRTPKEETSNLHSMPSIQSTAPAFSNAGKFSTIALSNSSRSHSSSVSLATAPDILTSSFTNHLQTTGLHSFASSDSGILSTIPSHNISSASSFNPGTSRLPITNEASPSVSSHLLRSTSIHWRTVTVCPWDTMYTAAVMASSDVTSSHGMVSSHGKMSSFEGNSTLKTALSSRMSQSVSLSPSSAILSSSSSVAPSWTVYPSVSSSVVTNASDILPIATKGCNVILQGLAQVMGQMTACLIENLRPIEVCGKCTKFHSLLREYEALIHNTDDCDKKLILDYNAQYQAITKMYRVQYDMWQDFECEKCYKDRADTDPKAPWIPKEEFLKSQSLVQEIMVCFANYSEFEVNLPYPVMLNISKGRNGTSWKSNKKICTECRDLYRTLKKYMKSIHFEGSAEKRWCADMVYGFNETRRIWGQFCIAKQQDQESIIALTCFFCFLPVVFYVGTKLHSDVKERKNETRVNYESD